jgi:DNA-binding transcriptional ArsR family regulator
MVQELRKQVSDVRALRALASPIRRHLLNHLMAVGPQTASECAAVVGASPSNCSYHLRELARYGLVERAGDGRGGDGRAGDGRDRPWRPAATGLSYGPAPDDAADAPGDRVAELANQRLVHAQIDDNAALLHRAIDAHDEQPAEWQRAEVLSTFGLLVTPDELVALTASVDALLRPYIGLTREEVPARAEHVHVVFDAVRRPGTIRRHAASDPRGTG